MKRFANHAIARFSTIEGKETRPAVPIAVMMQKIAFLEDRSVNTDRQLGENIAATYRDCGRVNFSVE